MDGFLLIDKPLDMTSYDVIRSLKKILPRKTKIGHLGTLDPMASGVLPIAIGQATKVIPFIPDETKEYMATLTLGGFSDTEDAWGNITYSPDSIVNEQEIRQVIENMVGEIEQVPPMYSAVRHQGKRLYELARQGAVVERQARKAYIYKIEILTMDLRSQFPEVKFRVACSKGTYIRTLCKDIGEILGIGGYLSGLIRTKSGIFEISDSCQLQDIVAKPCLLNDSILDIDYPVRDWPIYKLKNETEYLSVINGNTIYITEKLPPSNLRIYDESSLVAFARTNLEDSSIRPIRVFKTFKKGEHR
ncbi:MAG TPA: tRNA pseudouridine(55) synthase TruB [Syntrophomonadaceae bacterium]|nr:tRNA pseudouridine(55) synthase TruB [Syntrophomonadaceae bacterium]